MLPALAVSVRCLFPHPVFDVAVSTRWLSSAGFPSLIPPHWTDLTPDPRCVS